MKLDKIIEKISKTKWWYNIIDYGYLDQLIKVLYKL